MTPGPPRLVLALAGLGVAPLILMATAAMVATIYFLARDYHRRRTAGLLETLAPLGFSRVPMARAKQAVRAYRRLFPGRVFMLFRRGGKGIPEEHLLEAVQDAGEGDSVWHDVLACKVARLPGFRLRPEGIFDRLAALLGFEGIDFGESPDFSSRYHLTGKSKSAVRRLFARPVRRALAANPGWRVGSAEGWLVLHERRRRGRRETTRFLDRASEVADLFRESPGVAGGPNRP